MLQKIQDAHLFGVERIVEGLRDVGDLGEIDREQEDVRDVDLPGALEHAGRRDHESLVVHGAAVHEGGGEA